MLKYVPLFCALLVPAIAETIWPDAAALPAASFPNAATQTIALGKGLTIPAKFELTEKGNGGLEIPGVGLRVYDAQRDGVTFRNYLLLCEWKDLNGDGILDLSVSGTAQFWSEKGDRVEVEKPIRAVAHFSPIKKAFELITCSPEIYSWTNRATATDGPSTKEK